MIYLRKLSSFLFILSSAVLLVGCVATQEDVGGLYARQNKLEARMDTLSEQVEVVKTKSFGAEAGTSNVGDQVFQLETKVYELEQKIAGMDTRIDGLQNEIKGLKKSVADTRAKQEEAAKARKVAEAQKVEKKPEPAPVVEKEPELTDFDKGYRNLSEGKYKLAREQFNSYIKERPESTKIPDALFWIADSYYRERKYEEAILEYQKLIDTYPDDSRVPLAYLKQGLSLMNLDKNEEAKLFFETLIDKYPDSEEAEEARKKLQELEAKS